ncbi:MAG: cobaltochelatase subunit CobN [Rhodospirillales bacterium]|nr:cobaltochelatase subunit CobN [Rhodospirillales bacterium]
MHLLAATPGRIGDEAAAVDLAQTPADVIVLSAADSELVCLAAARARLAGDAPSLRLANLLRLGHPFSVDLYVEKTIAKARLVIVRLLGGRSYWPFGVERIASIARQRGIGAAFLPGDDQPDPDLQDFSTLPAAACHRLWQYLVHGGVDNGTNFLRYARALLGDGGEVSFCEPRPLLKAGLWWPGSDQPTLAEVRARWPQPGLPVAALIFYRALVQAGHTAAVTAMTDALAASGMAPLPVYVTSLKDPLAAATVAAVLAEAPPDVIVNTTGFAVASPGGGSDASAFAPCDAPVLQAIFAASDVETWRAGTSGLGPRDIAMNVALPEVDGRIITRAVAFKAAPRRDEACEADLVGAEPVADRIAFVAELAAAWARLRRTPAAERRIALILANYPNRDGRLGNGVGLDTPASVIAILDALAGAGYYVADPPADGRALIERLLAGPTNAGGGRAQRVAGESLAFADYAAAFARLPAVTQAKVAGRWGAAESDPFHQPGELDCGRFTIAAVRFGNVVVAVQPARGYNIDPAASYHDPDLPPPHGYLAFYVWLRETFGAHAVIHVGKHGNLEWLPGRSLALGADCFPEAALGPLPHLYPFIVNDPGEGTQAKRRAAAVIIDHLTPPLTRAESYGALKDLEHLVDEYYEAAQIDPRRLKVLASAIIDLMQSTGVARDCGISAEDRREDALMKLDRYLCELKEMQIRDGLHIFGRAPAGRLARDLLVALARVPRGSGEGGDASLLRALADDLGLAFDPLSADPAMPWDGSRPAALAQVGSDPWRTIGDTIERLEALAAALVDREAPADPAWTRTRHVLTTIEQCLAPAVAACGERELKGLLTGLDGRFVAAGPSGAPTRGRPDVLPTGRNFYSVDTRAVPTPAAWTLGWKSAGLLIERYVQEHGNWPRRLAVTAWGTSNMRTGGDDIAQALALLGVRPRWDAASHRVVGFEILPLDLLDRPRVDVTLRISGFFRDAFPALVDLFDAAARAVAARDEGDDDNPLAAAARTDRQRLIADGLPEADAAALAGARVFGSKPGAYGAGLQALIDEKGWQSDRDLARAYVAWGGYAYGPGLGGQAAHGTFERRLKAVELVIQNQDNREHDILDSDDYYQFEGGITAAVRTLSGQQPAVYHADHSRPETPRIRTLEEEIGRVVRARVVNPKWIEGVMRHGYKGAFEMAATVDYLFAFAATARCVADHHFDAVYRAYIEDERVCNFIAENNPAALAELSGRLIEAQDRSLWRPAVNSARPRLDDLARTMTDRSRR